MNVTKMDLTKINFNILYKIINDKSNYELLYKKLKLSSQRLLENLLFKIIDYSYENSEIINRNYEINLIDVIFVLKMIENLNEKKKYTKKTDRKNTLDDLIKKSEDIISNILKGTNYNLKELINEIENFYLKTTRVSNATRNLFYKKVDKYYNKNNNENNNEKYKKQLRKILLNKKLSYTKIGQTFSSRSRERKAKIEEFLEKPNNILKHISNINQFYNLSKKLANKEIFNKFKTAYEKAKKNAKNKALEKEQQKALENAQKKEQQKALENAQKKEQQKALENAQNPSQQSTNDTPEEPRLLSKSEQNKENLINNLIKQLDIFIKTSTKIPFSLKPNKKKIRANLGESLQESLDMLNTIHNRNYSNQKKEDAFLNNILNNINNTFIKYNSNKTWVNTNKRKVITNITSIKNLLLKLNPNLNSKSEQNKNTNIKNLIKKLNDFITTSENIKIIANKDYKRELEKNLAKYIEDLKHFNNKSFNNKKIENETLNNILQNIIDAFRGYQTLKRRENTNNQIKDMALLCVNMLV